MYYVVRPQGRTNYGTLILPTRALPALALTTLDGAPFPAAQLKGQWLLVSVGDAGCGGACETRLYLQRQLRETLGRDRDRLDKVWFVTGSGMPRAKLRTAASPPGAPLTMLRVDRAALARWLAPAAGHALEDHFYIVDPMGEWMMRTPADPDPAKVKRDLERLLRASASWDQPGR
jgi:cytochrome oxidase Cu insertion factor (SCO1/SenC/PrrC family)